MSIRLTESRLRQIIREELASLRESVGSVLSMEDLESVKKRMQRDMSSLTPTRDEYQAELDQEEVIMKYDDMLRGKTIEHKGEEVEIDWVTMIPGGPLVLNCVTQDGRRVRVSI
jgi:hypothetical protein